MAVHSFLSSFQVFFEPFSFLNYHIWCFFSYLSWLSNKKHGCSSFLHLLLFLLCQQKYSNICKLHFLIQDLQSKFVQAVQEWLVPEKYLLTD